MEGTKKYKKIESLEGLVFTHVFTPEDNTTSILSPGKIVIRTYHIGDVVIEEYTDGQCAGYNSEMLFARLKGGKQ